MLVYTKRIPIANDRTWFRTNLNNAFTKDKSQNNDIITFRRGKTSLRFDAHSGVLTAIIDKNKPTSLGNFPSLEFAAEDANLRKNTSKSSPAKVTQKDGAFIIEAKNTKGFDHLKWTLKPNGEILLDYAYTLPAGNYHYAGIGMRVSADDVLRKRWMGEGPARIWKNRTQGGVLDVYTEKKKINIPGQVYNPPEFEGCFAPWNWVVFYLKNNLNVGFLNHTDVTLGVLNPVNGAGPKKAVWHYPEQEGFFFFDCISSVGSKWKPAEEFGPDAQPTLIDQQIKGSVSMLINWNKPDQKAKRMNETGVFNGSAVVVQPLENGLVDLLNDQDGLYTLYLRGIEHGETVNQHELITSVSRGLNPYRDWSDYLETAKNPDLRFVVSNTTEAGITYVQTERPTVLCAASFPAKLTAWLAARFEAFGGSAESGMILLPCELINHNGAKLKECVNQHAEDWKLGDDFFHWLENHCTFLNTLVDRIVPGYPLDEIEAMTAELGYEDQLICAGEIFHLLVIEGPAELQAELPFHQAGLNVVWTDDMQPYRTRKVGILNGAHTSTVLSAFLGGVDTVGEMMKDADFDHFVNQVVFKELVPALPMDRAEVESFASAVMERFQNPFIQHQLLSISLNSVSKWKVRVLPSVISYMESTGNVPPLLAFSLAALIAFYKGDLREGYSPNDDSTVIDFISNAWKSGDVVDKVLGHVEFWGEDLRELSGFADAVGEALKRILKLGMRVAATDWVEIK